MKYVFASIFIVLCLATLGDHFSRPGVLTDKPVLYWVTNVSAAREKDVEEFQRWLKRNDYPDFELRLDSASNDVSKKLMQGVSGVGADIIDLARDEPWFLNSTGMLEDLTPYAQKHGFTPEATWKAHRNSIVIDGRQVGFPRSVTVQAYFVNVGLFENLGLPLPPQSWTFDEFERIGKEFIRAANPPGERQKVFFADKVNPQMLRRSMGVSDYNETMTRSNLDQPGTARVYELMRKWTYEDKILPSQADMDFYAGSGTVTARGQLFQQGKYALMTGGRYAIVQMRESGIRMRLEAREAPHHHFPNTVLGSGSTGIYKHSKHKDLAAYFLEYLTSREHNMHIASSGDAIPPVPAYSGSVDFLRPPEWQNEWGLHSHYARAVESLAIGISVSPFILPSSGNRIEAQIRQAVLSGVYTPEEAGRIGAERVNRQIQINVNADPGLRQEYDRLVEVQKEIERLRDAGELVPLDMITNPFYRKYYLFRGWSQEDTIRES